MAAGVNWYRADLRELSFVLFEQFRLGELLGKAPFAAWGVGRGQGGAGGDRPLRPRGARAAQRLG